MTTKEVQHLERAAVAAHRDGQSFATFWPTVAKAVEEQHPWNRAAFHRLHDRLMHLVICGNSDGQYAAGDADATPAWERDDTAGKPHDTETAARLQPGAFSEQGRR